MSARCAAARGVVGVLPSIGAAMAGRIVYPDPETTARHDEGENMNITHRIAWGALLTSMAIATDACAAEDATCAPDAPTAAVRFVRLVWSDPKASVAMIAPASLVPYRGRLEQLMEDRYSPMSSPLRRRVLGEDWTPGRLHGASDSDLVGDYFANSGLRHTAALTSEPVVRAHHQQPLLGDVVTVTYEGQVDGAARQLERKLVVNLVQGCWMLDMPVESWVALDQMASLLRKARSEVLPGREGPSLARLEVVEASDKEKPGMVARPEPPGDRTSWISRSPLANEADVVGAEADWDCDQGRGPAGPAVQLKMDDDAGRRIAAWSRTHIGDQMAFVVDGQVWTRATVQSQLGSKFTLCVPEDGHGLDRADRLAKALRGVR